MDSAKSRSVEGDNVGAVLLRGAQFAGRARQGTDSARIILPCFALHNDKSQIETVTDEKYTSERRTLHCFTGRPDGLRFACTPVFSRFSVPRFSEVVDLNNVWRTVSGVGGFHALACCFHR